MNNIILMKNATTKEFWEKVRCNAEYKEIREKILATYNENRWDDIPVLKFAPRMRFYTDGDRSEFERDYFRRRRYLSSTAFLSLIYPENENYIKELEEIIWAICEEHTWVLPAHCGCDENDVKIIDLFNAETAFSLAEIQYFLKDRLHDRINTKIKSELKTRIVDNFDNEVQGWENGRANWTAVCSGNVGGVFMYAFPDKMEEHMERILKSMQCFINGFSKDGTCFEGPAYWHYGFGNFVWFADLLYQFTKGKTDLFEWENINVISSYMQRSFLNGNAAVSFSDSLPDTKADKGLQAFLRKRFPEDVSVLDAENCIYSFGNVMWMQVLRNIYYLDVSDTCTKSEPKDYYLQDAGQAIINREKYSFAIKAGDNNEPHNHNDIGSFILATEKGQILRDLGSGRYTRQYFKSDTRYDYFCNSSAGHNVPIINGKFQKEGKNFNGTLTHSGDVTQVDFKTAYDIPELKKLTRTVKYGENDVTLTDNFDIDYESFTERFVSYYKPQISGGEIKVSDVVIKYDSEKCTPQISEVQFDTHTKGFVTVYCLDFMPQLRQKRTM